MSTTVTNYLDRINTKFPVKGQDNDSQGFRDNWKNIYEAVNNLNSELDSVSYFSVKTNDLSSFYGNTFEDVTIKNGSTELYNLDLVSNSIKVNYQDGSYQKFQVNSGIYQLSVINWPQSGKSGRLRIAVTVPADVDASINFDSNYTSINSSSNLFELSSNESNIFEIWSEEGSDIVYVININKITTDDAEFTSTTWTNRLKLGSITNENENNVYYTGTNKSTIVRRGNQLGELGLVPNRVTKKLVDGVDMTSTSPIELLFENVADVVEDAFLYVSLTNTIFTVTEVTTTSVFISPGNFNVSLLDLEDPITLTNPNFYEQPTLLTLSSSPANTFTGIVSNFQGSIYADKHRLEVAYDRFGNGNTNTFVITTLQTSTETSVVSTDIADTKFVHSLIPMGTIIMWYGKKEDVPDGWTLCDNKGSIASIINGQPGPIIKVPNLTNRFIVGGEADAYEDYTGKYRGPGTRVSTTTTVTKGGLRNAVIVYHSHGTEFIGNEMPLHCHNNVDPGHNHLRNPYTQLTINQGGGAGDYEQPRREANLNTSSFIVFTTTNISVDPISIGTPTGIVYVFERGVSGTNKNIPPFYALYYIMKISGISNDKLPVISGDDPDPVEPQPWTSPPAVPAPPPPPPTCEGATGPTTSAVRALSVSPTPVPTFEFFTGQTSESVTITLTNTGTTQLQVYGITPSTPAGVTAIFNFGTVFFPRTMSPGVSFSFGLSFTAQASGEFLSNINVLYQGSSGGVEYKFINTRQNVFQSSGDSGGDTDSSGDTGT